MRSSDSLPHLCSHCSLPHHPEQHVRISNRFEELLQSQPYIDESGVSVRVKKRTELQTTIKLDRDDRSVESSRTKGLMSTAIRADYTSNSRQFLRRNQLELEPIYFEESSIEMKPPSRSSMPRQQPKRTIEVIRQSSASPTSLREILRKVASSSTALTDTIPLASPLNRTRVSSGKQIIFQKGVSGVSKHLKPVTPQMSDPRQHSRSIEKPKQLSIEKQLQYNPYLLINKNKLPQSRKSSQLQVEQVLRYLTLTKSQSATQLIHEPEKTSHILIPSIIGPISLPNPEEFNFRSFIPASPPFMHNPPSLDSRKCTYSDNRCLGFNWGGLNSDPYEIVFDSRGHVKTGGIYR